MDIFASFHEDGFNRIIEHVRRQRPSLFNYGTADVARNPGLLCKAIDANPIIHLRSNPLVTIEEPLSVPGTQYRVSFAVQVVNIQIDFHPGNGFELPAELNPPLSTQRLAIKLTVCGGIGCPPEEIVDQLIPLPEERDQQDERENGPRIPLPTRKLTCFCDEISSFE